MSLSLYFSHTLSQIWKANSSWANARGGGGRRIEGGSKRKTSEIVLLPPIHACAQAPFRITVSQSSLTTFRNQSRGDGSWLIALCALHVHAVRKIRTLTISWGEIYHGRGGRLDFVMDCINLRFSGPVHLGGHFGPAVYLCLLSNRIQAFSGLDK